MKKLIVMLTLGLLVTGSSFAQTAPQKDKKQRMEQRGKRVQENRKTPEQMAAKRTEMLTKKLDLNKSQQKKLQALNLKQAQEMQAMRAQRGEATNRESMRSERKASKARYEAELKDILNKKQYAQYEAHREEMRARYEQKREHRKGQRGERQLQRS
jgi:periplasmic protein CpxP/Spy